MSLPRFSTALALAAASMVTCVASLTVAADDVTPAKALALTPIQQFVDYAQDNPAQCTIRPEKESGVTSWVVRNGQGEVLRRFADTNNDNVVDQWCYFLDGVEVYRDVDSNFNGKADEYRWFNTAGTRWGVDKNEDGRVDSWRVISPHEVAEQIIFALKAKDAARFQLLLLTPEELGALGLGQSRGDAVATSVKSAPDEFSKILNEQKAITPQSRYIDFGSARPGTIPAGTAGSTKDITVCDNAAALVQNSDKHEQVFLGTLVAVGNAWKLIAAPAVGGENQQQNAMPLIASNSPTSAIGGGDGAPNDEMQKQMAELERLDKESDTLPPDRLTENIEKRVAALKKLAEISPANTRNQWYFQLTDILSVAIQSGNFPQGIERLDELQKEFTDAGADADVIAHAVFQRLWAKYALDQQQPNADAAKLQTQWVTDLQAFINQYPKSNDTAEALYQLGLLQEIVGKSDEAVKLYQQLADGFSDARPAPKAKGALYRLKSEGNPLRVRGADLQGGAAIDSAAPQYRGKVLLIHYWGTVGQRWNEDFEKIRDIYSKRAGTRDFDVVGVCLDDDPTTAKQYLAQKKLPWKQIYEKGGLDGRLANEMGVISLPLLILVDQKGAVAKQNVQIAELEAELAKLIKPAAPTANALRTPPTAR